MNYQDSFTGNRILIINVYLGKPLPYFNLFLESCRFNSNLNFLFFTDNLSYYENYSIPSNVKIEPISIEKFNELASQKIGIPVDIKFPYKLCDFKVTYGEVFSDYLVDYDFWGFCDTDMIFGDTRILLHEQNLQKYDIICARKEYIYGPLTVFRNTEKINSLFKQSKDYQKVLKGSENYSFTECNFRWMPLLEGKSPLELETDIESFTQVVHKGIQSGTVKALFETCVIEMREDLLKTNCYWENGKLFDINQKEYILIHFVNVKRDFSYIVSSWNSVPRKIHFTPIGFQKFDTVRDAIYSLVTIRLFILRNFSSKVFNKILKSI